MTALVSIEPECEPGLTVVLAADPEAGLPMLLELISNVVDDIRLRMKGVELSGLDDASIQAIDSFIASKDGVLVADDGKYYCVAERGGAGAAAIIFTSVGIFRTVN